jgi:hypothetical protein
LIVPSSVAVYEHMLLVPAILWLLAQKGAILGANLAMRSLWYLAAAAISWQWLVGSAIVVFLLVFPNTSATGQILLPLRTAAGVPFAVAALGLVLVWKENLAPAKSRTR